MPALGWYGKLPALGDFASRRLPATFIEPWDAWLQASIEASREALGADWLDRYLHAPIRRFALGARVFGGGEWLGILVPSVDRVGRHFPLTIAAAESGDGAFEPLESAALAALEANAKLEAFDCSISALAAPRARPVSAGTSRWWYAGDEDVREFAGLPPPAAFTALLAVV